jgi:hypothetical protein
MIQLAVLLLMLLLAACGTSTPASTAPPTESAEIATGVLRVIIAGANDGAPGKALASSVAGKNFRVVIRHPTLQVNGQAFSVIQDTVPGGSLSFALPVSTNYTVEALAYSNDPNTGLNTVLKYAIATSVRVDATGASAAVLTLTPVEAKIVLPSSLQQGESYNALANFSSAGGRRVTPLHANWCLMPPKTTTYAPFSNHTAATNFASAHFNYAPATYGVPTNLYFQGVFTLKPTLLGAGEKAKQWIYNAPEVSLPVLAPTNLTIVAPVF